MRHKGELGYWAKLGYPKCPIPRNRTGYDKLARQWYADNGYAVPRNAAEYRILLAARNPQLAIVRGKYRAGYNKPIKRSKYIQNDKLLHYSPTDYYVYEYIHPLNNTCFYVGCGTGKRYLNIISRDKEFLTVIAALKAKSLEPKVTIIEDKLTWEAASELENRRIMEYVIHGVSLTNRMFVINNITYLRNVDDNTWYEQRYSRRRKPL